MAGNNALLRLYGRSVRLKGIDDPALIRQVFDYAEAMLPASRALPSPPDLAGHVYDRFVDPAGAESAG